MNNRLIKSNDAGGGACTNTVDLYNPFPDGGGVALYQLNGDATDVSGNYNGTVSGGTFENNGVFGQCWDTTGTADEYITATQPPNVKTVSAWVRVSGTHTNSVGAIVWSNGGSSPSISYFLGISVDGKIYAFATYLDALTRTINLNQWYHIAATLEGTTVKVYLDGDLVETRTTAYPEIVNGTQITMGRSNYAGNYHNLHGSIDQVRLFTRALRPYEVEALYTEEYCTPTIVPSEHFNTVTYTGTGVTQSITGVGFQPDLVWYKNRNTINYHELNDSVRGAGYRLFSNESSAESYVSTVGLTSFDSDGFTVGTGNNNGNKDGDGIVAWNFKAGGAAVSNTDGTITSQVSANTEAGFSVIKYTGNFQIATVGHGLSVAPKVLIQKRLDASTNWFVKYDITGSNKYLILNETNAEGSAAEDTPTDTVFSLGASNNTNNNNSPHICYAFAEVEGFSNFGSYVGNGSTTNVVTGFEPAFLIVKETSTAGSWFMIDNKRGVDKRLLANVSDAEGAISGITFLENGFGISGGLNSSSTTFIYMAFAADPTTIEPTLEDSFNTVLFNGDNTSSKFIPVGFTPDFLWLKSRDTTTSHALYDSVRGDNSRLVSNGTGAADNVPNEFADNGFNIIGGTGYNDSSLGDQVAWCWKGAELPAINSNGSIPSVVSANPDAGFSIVSYTGNQLPNQTIGHGLGKTPDMIITKGRANLSLYDIWDVWHKDLTSNYILQLQSADAETFAGVDQRFVTSLNSDTVFGVGWDDFGPNSNGTTKIAYCFAEVAGFSKFGSYTGNGSTSGPTIDCGFEPAFIMFKGSSIATEWGIFDNKRDTVNPNTAVILAQSTQAEAQATGGGVNFLSNGFQLNDNNSNRNASGQTYIYMAFANQF